jgi:hypothetical protein
MENTSKTSNVITINGTDYSEDSFSKEQTVEEEKVAS